MVDSIKSFTRIHKTCVHWSIMSGVVLDNAFYGKNTHASILFGLKSKLVIMCNKVISCRLDYCNVPTHKTDQLQRIQNQCARILTKSPRRERITPV